jgi:hypothetical protein
MSLTYVRTGGAVYAPEAGHDLDATGWCATGNAAVLEMTGIVRRGSSLRIPMQISGQAVVQRALRVRLLRR